MIMTKVEKNILNKTEIEELKKYIEAETFNRQKVYFDKDLKVDTNVSIIQGHVGRIIMHFNLDKIPKSVYKKIYEYALKLNNNCIPYSFIYSRYSLEYGIPKLLPHTDSVGTDFTIDYQLDSNTKWLINVDNNGYSLENNDALIFASSDLMHWREPKNFSKNEYVDMVFFHFIDKNKNTLEKKPAQIKGDYIFEYYKKVKEL